MKANISSYTRVLNIIFTCLIISLTNTIKTESNQLQAPVAEWAIVGAGPAGIAVIGVLIDIGIDPATIAWIDPEFNVGRIGAYYNSVPANNVTGEFIGFVNACECFNECDAPEVKKIKECNPQEQHELRVIIEPLRCITHHLRTKVTSYQTHMTSLDYNGKSWRIGIKNEQTIYAKHTILAIGSRPKTLNYETQEIIPLDTALDPHNLQELIKPDDVVGVVGGSHSAILLLKFLSEMPVKHIYNFYKKPIVYAVNLDGWVLNADIGLKGITAEWAQNILEKNPPENLTRLKSTPETLTAMLPECDKTIYAIGYERNPLPAINGIAPIEQYNSTNGFIAPRLFGIGLAFPETNTNLLGREQACIGLDCFMEYAQKMIPHWLEDDMFKQGRRQRARAQLKKLTKNRSLFSIWTL